MDSNTIVASALALTLLLTGGATAAAVADTTGEAHVEPPDERSFVVALQADGSAEVTVVTTFDLTDDDRRQAFESLRSSETAQAEYRDRFADRMATVAADTSAATGREMSVSNATVEFATVDDTGVVQSSVTWEGLAAVEDESLVLTEPFASGFEPDRPLSVVAPHDYDIASTTPAPDGQDGRQVTWAAGTDLSGFELTAAPAAAEAAGTDDGEADEEMTDGNGTADTATADGDGPGFGIVAALVGILTVAAVVRRRIDSR